MAAQNARAERQRWIWIASAWSAFGFFNAVITDAVMRSEGMHHAWLKLFGVTLFSWLPWALATNSILRLAHRFPPGRRAPLTTWFMHIGAALALGLVSSFWTGLMELIFNPYANSSPPPPLGHLTIENFLNGLFGWLILYAAILVIRVALDSRERLVFQQVEMARLSEHLARAQLNALRRQVEPHFLFNALNAIAGLVRERRTDAAVGMIASLSDFLRRTLEESDRQEVPLSQEMEFVQKYLDIQKARFVDRLQLSVDVPSDLHSALVPNLILQPLVENAVNHGIAKLAQGGAIRIAASCSSELLTVSVSNDGPNLPTNWGTTRGGIGIANVRMRLQNLYGDGFGLSMRNREAGGVEAVISVPFRKGLAAG